MPRKFENSLTGGRDRLLEAAQYKETLNRDVATQVGTVLSIHGAMMEQQRNELAQKNLDLSLRNEVNQLRQEGEKKDAARAIMDFVGAYDPLESGSRANLDKYKAFAVGAGITAPEINQIFATADMKNQAVEQVITSWRDLSGVDWVKDENGRIDLEATRSDHEQRLRLQAEQKATWAPNDHRAYTSALQYGMRPFEAMDMITESARARNLYREIVENQLYSAPNQEDFNKKFVASINPSNPPATGSNVDPLLSPFVFNASKFYMDEAVIAASKNLNRVKQGEIPVFQTDENGNVQYDGKGLALIKSWTPSPEQTKKIAEANKATAEAVTAQDEAEVNARFLKRTEAKRATSSLGALGITPGGTGGQRPPIEED